MQVEPAKIIEETSEYVRPERVNKRPKLMTATEWRWWWLATYIEIYCFFLWTNF
jgi:hypothetical protein